jgi:hypothetical protein
MTARADFDRMIVELASARCKQDTRVILAMNKTVLDWITGLPAKRSDTLTERVQSVIAELPEHE